MEGLGLPVILLALGMAAFFLEAFVPSGGLISVAALACVIGSVVFAFNRLEMMPAVVFTGAAIILAPTALISAFLLLPKTSIGRRLTLRSAQAPGTGYVAQDINEDKLVGQKGVALSPLRPSGEARIGDRRYDVITEGEMIENGTPIEVRSVGGNRIVVRAAPQEPKKT